MLATAPPFEAVADAISVLLRQLEQRGLGRWSLHDAWSEPVAELGGTTVPIALQDGSLLGLLRPHRPGDDELSIEEVAAVRDTARVLATVLDAESRADRSYRRAIRAEAESVTDALTGLPNGRSWWAKIAGKMVKMSIRTDRG
jgi:hypothetical protein